MGRVWLRGWLERLAKELGCLGDVAEWPVATDGDSYSSSPVEDGRHASFHGGAVWELVVQEGLQQVELQQYQH